MAAEIKISNNKYKKAANVFFLQHWKGHKKRGQLERKSGRTAAVHAKEEETKRRLLKTDSV